MTDEGLSTMVATCLLRSGVTSDRVVRNLTSPTLLRRIKLRMAGGDGGVGRSRAVVEAASPTGSVRLEHVRARRTVRVIVRRGSGPRETMLEIDVGHFLDRLGLTNWPAADPVAFLIFAGNAGRTVGGAGDFVGSFSTETEARIAFGEVCGASSPDWAQLVRVENGGRLSVVCWRGPAGGRKPLADLSGGRAVTAAAPGRARVVSLARRARLGKGAVSPTVAGQHGQSLVAGHD